MGDEPNPNPNPNPNPAPTDWYAGLPADLQGEKSLEGFKGKGVADVARSYVEAQKLVGSSLRLPKQDAKPEERATFVRDIQTKLGLPDKPEGYALKDLDGKVIDAAALSTLPVLKGMLGTFHKAGLLPEQAQMIVEAYRGLEKANATATAQAVQKAEQALREKWGGEFDRKFQLADRLISERAGPAKEKLVAAGLHNDPDVIAWLAEIAEPFAEHGIIRGEVEGGMSPAQAAEMIKAAEADKNHEFWKKTPEEQRRLHQLAWGTTPIQM